jgi:hypothetical protein
MASFWDFFDWIDGLFNNIKITRNIEIPILILVIRFWEVKTSWFTIWIPYPDIVVIGIDTGIRQADGSDFDYQSIMLYQQTTEGGITMKQNFTGYSWRYAGAVGDVSTLEKVENVPWVTGEVVPGNVFISEKDAQTVKMIFGN